MKLTNRQKEILALVAEGYTSKEIGDKLFLSSRTVEWHRQEMMRIFKAKNRVELLNKTIYTT